MYKITKDDKPLARNLYRIDTANHTFTSKENGLVLDFAREISWFLNIRSGDDCSVTAGNYINITIGDGGDVIAGNDCVISADYRSTIEAGDWCTITAEHESTITAGDDCRITVDRSSTIYAGSDCNIIADDDCTISVYDNCVVTVDDDCNISVGNDCVIVVRGDMGLFITAGKNCVVIRTKINETINLVEGQVIELNNIQVQGYEVLETEEMDEKLRMPETFKKYGDIIGNFHDGVQRAEKAIKRKRLFVEWQDYHFLARAWFQNNMWHCEVFLGDEWEETDSCGTLLDVLKNVEGAYTPSEWTDQA